MSDLKAELRALVADVGGLPPDFDSSAHLYNDLGVASLKALQLLFALEERYQVQIQDAEFVDATSLDNLYALMSKLVAVKGL